MAIKSKPMTNAIEYIDNQMRAQNGDVGIIAWRFLIGCRILECMEDMEKAPPRGTDIQVLAANQDSHIIRLGDYKIHIAHEPNGEST